jgi:hypothetical protein
MVGSIRLFRIALAAQRSLHSRIVRFEDCFWAVVK